MCLRYGATLPFVDRLSPGSEYALYICATDLIKMKATSTLFLTTLVVSLAFTMTTDHKRLVVGGELVEQGQFSFAVFLDIAFNGPPGPQRRAFCAGSLLDQSTVLTAAHCVSDRSNRGSTEGVTVQVRAGSLVGRN